MYVCIKQISYFKIVAEIMKIVIIRNICNQWSFKWWCFGYLYHVICLVCRNELPPSSG